MNRDVVKVKACGEGTPEYPNRFFQCWLVIGVQSFAVGPRCTRERAEWFKKMLDTALDKFKRDDFVNEPDPAEPSA